MNFLTPGIAERINAGDVTHEDFVNMLAKGLGELGAPPGVEKREAMLADARARFPKQDDLVAHLREMLAQYIRFAEPGTRQ